MDISKTMETFQLVNEKIRQAIISKGVDVPEGASLSEMAQKISEIKIGSNKNEKKHA